MTGPPVVDEVLLRSLREDLAAFTPESVDAVLGPVASAALAREQPVPARRACAAARDDPVATLTSLFVLGGTVRRADLDHALPATGAAGAERLALVSCAGTGRDDDVRALLDLRPYAAVDDGGSAHWWIASDLGEVATGSALSTDHVLGVGGASVMLARCTIRTPVVRVLDLGTGCGVQALHALRHATSVVATDLSRRALAFARFTLALNAVPDGSVDLRRGDLLEPVRGELFDLVVSNPPFVITPRRPGVPAYEYRDAGGVGDDVVRRLVTGVGDLLAAGGVAQMLANWEVHAGESWADRVTAWLDAGAAARLDAWVVQRELLDPAEYAELWIRDGGVAAGAAQDDLYAAWLDDFAARGVEAVGFGLVTLRRPAATAAAGTRAGMRRIEDVRGGGDGPLGEHLATALAHVDWLAARDDAALLDSRLVVAGDVTQEQSYRPGRPDPDVVVLRQGAGFARAVRVGTELAAVVGACDGDLTLGQITGGVAVLLDRTPAQVRAAVLPGLRSLVADAFLAPAPAATL